VAFFLAQIFLNPSTLGIWTALAATYVIHHNLAAGKAVVAMIFVYYTFYDIAYSRKSFFTVSFEYQRSFYISALLVAYTVEILPYQIRAKGIALMNLCVSASLVFNQ
jgi:hypothetical protein